MKHVAAAIVLAAGLAGCGESAPAPTPPAAPATPSAPPQGRAAQGQPDNSPGAPPAAPAADAYPLKTCVVSGEPLGGMGDPYVLKHEGVEVRLCCVACKKEFDKDPKAFVAKVQAAMKK